ncbi:uncharacterized protein LOC117252159 [Epinephelus lanceolatus]|uniref:zinc finger protein 791-like n=1 Tax=Epinephelus lanceolatus TaxID=310571 RepID=UPI001446F820|nr:zinc finger protein 791-like [Epinephelus lanceolatus]
MSSVEYLREFVSERLTAAAEEIFRVFKSTIMEYEEEIHRQRRLLDNIWKPTELPQQSVCKEEEEVQERSSTVDQEDPEPPHIKEEQEELCKEELVLKQETDAFIWNPSYEDSEHDEDQTVTFSPDETAEDESGGHIPSISFVLTDPNREQQLRPHSSHQPERQRHTGGGDGDAGSTRDADAQPKTQHHINQSHSNNMANMSGTYHHTGKKSFRCDTCGKDYKYRSLLQRHLRTHTGEKPFTCKICGKGLKSSTTLTVHMRTHTGEKPYVCKICGKRFCDVSALIVHMRIHTGEKPYTCNTCGRAFRLGGDLTVHMRTHTGEKPYVCKICGKRYVGASNLARHIRSHTDK